MSTQNLDKLFAPRSVALIGASDKAGSVGALTMQNLRTSGFGGELFFVNPAHQTIDGMKIYPDVGSLPAVPDLAIVAIPPERVPGSIGELGKLGTKAAVVLTAGFAEFGDHGLELQRAMLDAARPYGLRIVGPNCVGLIVPPLGLNGSFAQLTPQKGEVAFVSQSGALVTVVLDWTQPRRIGFSKVVSLGDVADVDFGDVLNYLCDDEATRAIVLYIEGITDAPKFMAAAQRVAAAKPVLALKVGRHAEAAKAAHSHTGALAGSDVVYDAAFRRAGILRVTTMPELFDALETLALTGPVSGDRLAILTNGGGPGVIATDAIVDHGARLAELGPSTLERLNAVLPKTWSHGNPVDMIGDSPPHAYADVLDALLRDEGIDGVLVLHAPTSLANPSESARAVLETVKAHRDDARKPNVYTAWLGEYLVASARKLFVQERLPTYETPEDAVEGFMHRVRFERSQEVRRHAAGTYNGWFPDAASAARVLERAKSERRTWLEPDEITSILGAYGVPSVRSRTVTSAEEAGRAAAEIGGSVALKIRSPQLTHKTEIGGVALDLRGEENVRGEAQRMLERVKKLQPGANIEGFLVQEMISRPGAIELIVGTSVDNVFGPVILFGQGGTAVELIADTSLELAPLNKPLARAQMARTRVWKLLQGYRGTPSADIDAIADVLVKIARLAVDQPSIAELDINPLLADSKGVIALDARIMVRA